MYFDITLGSVIIHHPFYCYDLLQEKILGRKFFAELGYSCFNIQMNVWFVPTADPLINTFLRSIIVIVIMILGFQTSWYSAYWGAIVHDIISLVLIRDLV